MASKEKLSKKNSTLLAIKPLKSFQRNTFDYIQRGDQCFGNSNLITGKETLLKRDSGRSNGYL